MKNKKPPKIENRRELLYLVEGKSGAGKTHLAESLTNYANTRRLWEEAGFQVYRLDPWNIGH